MKNYICYLFSDGSMVDLLSEKSSVDITGKFLCGLTVSAYLIITVSKK